MTPGINRSIRECHAAGTVTSATLMANGPAFGDAVTGAAQVPRLGVGCHVVLVDGVPVCDPHSVPSLLDSDDRSRFPNGLDTVAPRAWLGKLNAEEIEAEAAAQIRKLQAAGIAVDHVDTHKHTHMFPQVLRPLLRAAKACGVRAVRNPFVPPLSLATVRRVAGHPALWKRFVQTRLLRTMAKAFQQEVAAQGFATTQGSLGVVATGAVNQPLFLAILRSLPEGTWEFVCHPGYDDADLAQVRTRLRASREREMEALTSPEARVALHESGVELTTFGDL